MAVPKKRKFSRRSVSKVVRLNHVCKKKNFSVGLQPELTQVSLRCYFFSSLYSALLSNLYAYTTLLLGSLSSHYVRYSITNSMRPSVVFLFKAPSQFSFDPALLVFDKSCVYVRSTPTMISVAGVPQQASQDCLRVLCGSSNLGLYPHRMDTTPAAVISPSDRGGELPNKSFSLKSHLSKFIVASYRQVVKWRRSLLSRLEGYFSALTPVPEEREHTSGTIVGEVFRKFFIHTAFYKKVQ